MTTWLDDLKRRDPVLARAYVLGGSPGVAQRNMIRALTLTSRLNTPRDDLRLAAAQLVRAPKSAARRERFLALEKEVAS